MNRALPPLQGLYCFYLAAEAGSFKEAAEQMFVTSAAMSQQIRQLEDKLGVALFNREHRKVTLTTEGKTLHHYARQAFNLLQDGVQQIHNDPDPSNLSLSVLPSFAQHWLVPRLGHFTEQYPDLSVFMMTTMSLVDFRKERVDLCVRFGQGDYPELESRVLMQDHLYPVAHPEYLKSKKITSLTDLPKATLIEDARPDMNWASWLDSVNGQPTTAKSAIRYRGAHMVIEGALAGQGVALARHSLAWKFIEQGVLKRLDNIEVRSPAQYYLVAPPTYFKREKTQQFAQWIKQEADQFWRESQAAVGEDRVIITG